VNNPSEKLLRTDIMQLLGGKGLGNEPLVPPPPPLVPLAHSGGGNDSRMPELVSSSVQEVLSRPPAWLIRWGTTVFFATFALLIAITWWVEYPDLVQAPLRVVPQNLPKIIPSRTEGTLVQLEVQDGDLVQSGQLLAYLESTAQHEEVLELERLVNTWIRLAQREQLEAIHQMNIPSFYQLGELQKSYQNFQQALLQSKSAVQNGVFSQKKNTLGQEIGSLRRLYSNTQDQLQLQEQDLQMAWEEAQSQQRLSDKGFVSKLEAKNAMSRYLNKKQALENAKSGLETNRMTQAQKQQEILEIEKSKLDQQVSIVQSVNTLKSDIEAWKQRYLVVATETGKVYFPNRLQVNQPIKNGQELMYILPNHQGYFGEMAVGQYNFGKIKVGQEVIVKFPSYPFQEFGTVSGQITNISDMAKDSVYLVQVQFPNGLVTTNHKNLPYKNGLVASGEIVTENMRLLERFFYDIRKTLIR